MKARSLTPSQKVVYQKIVNFLEGPDKYFLLTGQPGVGKTFVLRYALEDLLNEESNHKKLVIGVTLAHQAKKQLRKSVPNSVTFAKAYGLKEKYDEVTGEREFKFDEKNKEEILGKKPYPVFVHDEVSQYTQEMLNIVENNTSFESKVIFVGDKAQLPPIDKHSVEPDEDSAVFNWQWTEETSHELTEIVRQGSTNPILKLAKLMRQEIFGNQNITSIKFMLSYAQMENGYGYQYISEDDICDYMGQFEGTDSLILAHTRKRVASLNKTVRTYLRGNPKDVIVPEDILYMKDTYRKLGPEGFPLFTIENSEFVKITEIQPITMNFKHAGLKASVESYLCKLENDDRTILVPSMRGSLPWNKFINELADKCRIKKFRWDMFWDIYRTYAQYNYGYAMTTYKCQGSTYENVIVDINDIINCKPLSNKRKLQSIYTAMTRASKGAYFIQ
jgi:exodeoxyribonuclease-5